MMKNSFRSGGRKEGIIVLTPKKMYFSAVLAAVIIAMAFSASSAQAASSASSPVGVVDFIYLIDHHPDAVQANEALKAEQEVVKKEFIDKSVGLNDTEKQNLDRQLGQRLEQKRQELLKPITNKVLAAAQEVATEKGLSIVIGKNEVICGGVDITADVLKKITGQ